MAYARYSRGYVKEEARANVEKLGVRAHHCQPAWEWRAQKH